MKYRNVTQMIKLLTKNPNGRIQLLLVQIMVQIKHLKLGQHTLLNERFADVCGTSDEQDKKKRKKEQDKRNYERGFQNQGQV